LKNYEIRKKTNRIFKKNYKNCIHGKNIFAKRNKNEINIFYEKYKKFYNLMHQIIFRKK